jgi:hypothetical protein
MRRQRGRLQEEGEMKKRSTRGPRRSGNRKHFAAALSVAFAANSYAFEIETGNSDLAMRWDTTLKYSAAWRVKSADPIYLSTLNEDDGDRNLGKGLISNRVDLFTELDAVWQQRFGARFSAAGWYDGVYNKNNDNPGYAGGAYPNNLSVPYYEFTHATRKVMGRDAEVLDAFVFGKFDAWDTPVTFRAGQFSLVWGESLFFGNNAIAGGMMTYDAIKLSMVPGTQFKETVLPLPMVAGTTQLTPELSLGAYYQWKWQKSRLPAAGSYLSSDVLDYGGEQLLLAPGFGAPRLPDRDPANSFQGGLQLRYRDEATDYGFYAIRYNEKGPELVPVLGLVPVAPGVLAPIPTNYYIAFNQGVTAYAVTASRTFGLFNVAAEAGVRYNSSLASTKGADTSALGGVTTNVTNNPGYATGHTAHFNLSTIASLPVTFLWREATLTGEVAWNRVLSITKNAAAADPNSTRDGVAMRFVLEPTYRSVFPGVDIGVPFGVGYAPNGSRPLAASPGTWIPEGGGDLSIGLDGSFHDAWRFTVNYTHYYGSAAPTTDKNGTFTWKQNFADRDFVSASLRYSF